MKLINIGFGNMVSASRLVAIVSPESAPIKRIIQDVRDRGMLVDATYVLPAGESAPIMMLKVLAARHYADIRRILENIRCSVDTASPRAAVEWCTMPGKSLAGAEALKDGPPTYEIRIHMLQLGMLCWWGFSGELYSSLGKAVQTRMHQGTHIILNHDASLMANSGYIFDDETLTRDTRCELPGQRSSAQLPGYGKDQILRTVSDMWAHPEESEETL